MDTEAQGPVSAFCEWHISQNRQKWPAGESELAEAFVKHFRIPFLASKAGLQDFLIRANIELTEDNLPPDLLGVHMSFEGKTRILTSRDADHIPFRIHTILHEIREIIEADFIRRGFATTRTQDLDSRADEFAFAVYFRSIMNPLEGWVENLPEMNSWWEELVSFGVFTAVSFVFLLHSFFGAYGYRFSNSAVKRPFLKHI